ncbi:MAG: antitoxin [Planctomycetota bacterium]|nr:antitoxin [Planctomycetota bacterium]
MENSTSPEASLWRERLTMDASVSPDSPVVKGTWITVGQVISRIVDGWSWSEILRSYPELCQDDIRACLAFTVEDEGSR